VNRVAKRGDIYVSERYLRARAIMKKNSLKTDNDLQQQNHSLIKDR